MPIPHGLAGDFYGTGDSTFLAYLCSTALLLAVIVLANLVPAYQASRMAPVRALRYE